MLAGQRRTGLAGWLRRPGRFPWSAQVPETLPKNPKLDRLQKFPNSVEMILRCIRWYPQRIIPHKLWKRCRSEYPSWQCVHLISFHELNPTQQPQNLTNSRSSKTANRGKKEWKNQIQIILDQRLRSQRAWLLYFHDLPGLVVLQRITYRKLKHRHSINLPHSGSQQQYNSTKYWENLEMRAGDMGKNWVQTPAPNLRVDPSWMEATCPKKPITHSGVVGKCGRTARESTLMEKLVFH